MKKRGFTLAEVLITLIVIGVISALTIPNILQNTQNSHFKTAFKKIYSDLEQATKRMVIENGGSLAGAYTGNDFMRDKYLLYLSYIQKCDDADTSTSGPNLISNCWSKNDYMLNKSTGSYDLGAQQSQAILTNGAALDFWLVDSNCTSSGLSTGDECGRIEIDVNGFRGPNQVGRDVFWVYVTKNGIVPQGTFRDAFYGQCNPNAGPIAGFGWGCANYVLQNQDY